MKFSLLTVGQQFEYQGETFIKSTPLIAHQVDTGEQRLIPRSATVVSTNQSALPTTDGTSRINPCIDPCIDHGELQQAFMELEESLRDTLEQDARLARAFDRARQRFFERLNIASARTENHSSS